MRDRWTESEHPQEMTRQQRNTFSILHTVADLHRAEQANSVTVLRPQETGTVHGARITLVTVNWSSHSSALFVFHLRHCMSEYADADMQNAVREQWKWGSVFQNLKERGKKKDEIRGLVTYKNPKASSLAPDPTDRIILCFTAAPSQSYHYRIVVSLPQKETIRCVHFSTGMFLSLSNKHPLEDPSNKNEV